MSMVDGWEEPKCLYFIRKGANLIVCRCSSCTCGSASLEPTRDKSSHGSLAMKIEKNISILYLIPQRVYLNHGHTIFLCGVYVCVLLVVTMYILFVLITLVFGYDEDGKLTTVCVHELDMYMCLYNIVRNGYRRRREPSNG